MKKYRSLLIILLCAALLSAGARAEEALSGRIEGSSLKVTWNVDYGGECVLTVYQNDWPICVRNVTGCAGSVSIALGTVSGKYSLRLQTADGCLKGAVTGGSAQATRAPTVIDTPKPTEVATAAPVATPEPVPTATPVAEITQKPTEVATAAPVATPDPTSAPTATPTAAPTAARTAAPTRQPQVTAVSVSYRDDLAGQLITAVNAERAKEGLNALAIDAELTRAACVRAAEIAQSFSHTRPNGTSWSTISPRAYGENIAKGQRSVDRVMATWMSSSGHRANIMRASYGTIGVCVYASGGVLHWVQLFGK